MAHISRSRAAHIGRRRLAQIRRLSAAHTRRRCLAHTKAVNDNRLLEEQRKSTGLSVSALIRQAIQQCYGTGRRLTWEEAFAHKVEINSAVRDGWVYDDLFDGDIDELIEEQLSGQGK